MATGISLSGMASGMDTDEMVNELMQLERVPIQRMEFEKQEISVKQEQWQQVNQMIQSFEGTFDKLGSRSLYRDMTASSTNEDIMTIDANNSASEANYNVEVTQLAQAHSLFSLESVESNTEPINEQDLGFTIAEGDSFSINGAEIALSGDETLREIRNLINNTEDTGASASIVNGSLVITSDETGADSQLALADVNGTFLDDIGLITADDSNVMSEAQDAIFSINNMEITHSKNQGIDDVIEDVTLSLHSAAPGESFNISIGQDTGGIQETIEQFVEEYNSVQTLMGELGKEEGLLQGDGTLRRLQSSLRRRITTDVGLADNQFNNLQSLGIEIDDEGEMSFEASELQSALRDNPDDVQKFFRASEANDGTQGLANRMSDFLRSYVRFGDGILSRQNSNFDSRIDRIDRRIEAREQRMESRERTLQRQFARMETALNEIQAQGGWLQGQLQNLGLQQGN